MNGSPRPDAGQRAASREDRPEGGLTLARAFQLMAQALSEFRSPVGQEALRLRMVAMQGREDPLLDAGRFPRLLRQANDAEVAEVRKVGDDDYEISAQQSGSRPALPAPTQPEEPASTAAGAEPATETGGTAGRENGQRLGLRFRRGSRGPTRAGEIPLIGMVRIDPASEPPEVVPVEAAVTELTEAPKRPRPRRPPRKRAAADSPPGEPTDDPTADAPPPKRTRPRARKKPE
jgi:hypothetical protein